MQAVLDFLKFLGFDVKPVIKPEPLTTSLKPGARAHVVVKDGYKVMEIPTSGPALPSRGHAFEDVPSFAAFLNRHFTPATTEILATTEKIVAASAVLFERDTVTCVLARDPAFRAWIGMDKQTLNQKDLYRFLNSRREEIDAGGGSSAVLSSLRTLEVKFAGNAKMELTESGGVKFTGGAKGVEVEGVLPPGFKVTIPVYLAQSERFTLDVDLVPEIVEGKPAAFTIVLRNLDFVKQEAFETELSKLRDLLGSVEDAKDAAHFLVSRGVLSLA